MTYVKTNWVNGETPINATNLNKIEERIANAVVTDSEARLKNVVSKNKFNINTMIELYGQFRRATENGQIASNKDYYGIKVSVEPNKTYTISSDTTEYSNLVYFDSDFTYISGEAFNKAQYKTFTTPNNCYFITLAVKTPFTWIQIEEGATITDYAPYLNLEEAMKENNVYSTEERVIGTWINNKPLYRQVIQFTNLTYGTVQNVAHNISNAEDMFIENAWISAETNTSRTTRPFLGLSRNTLALNTVTDVLLQTYSDFLTYCIGTGYEGSAKSLVVIFNYTKTTDEEDA